MEAVILTMSGKHENLCIAVYSEKQNRLYRLVSDSSGGQFLLGILIVFLLWILFNLSQ